MEEGHVNDVDVQWELMSGIFLGDEQKDTYARGTS